MKLLIAFGTDEVLPLLHREYDLNIDLRVCVGHDAARLRGLGVRGKLHQERHVYGAHPLSAPSSSIRNGMKGSVE
jgi:hypothetical protein